MPANDPHANPPELKPVPAIPGRVWRWLAPACFALALLTVALELGLGSTPVAVGLLKPPLDKLAHMAYLGSIAALLSAGWRGRRPLAAFALASLAGVADEIWQIFLPGRHAGFADLAAGMAGALIGAYVVRWLLRRLEPKSGS